MDFETDMKINLEHQKTRFAQYGNAIGSVGYGSIESQETRFKVICETFDIRNRTMLDVGCGFGDLYNFLYRQDIHPKRYLGIEMNPALFNEAKKKLPEVEFKQVSLLDFESADEFDFVVACGLFGLESPNWELLIEQQLYKLYNLCKIGFLANFLSHYTTGGINPLSHYADPGKILEFALKNLSNRVVLRHDYMPNDFTICVFKG